MLGKNPVRAVACFDTKNDTVIIGIHMEGLNNNRKHGLHV
jgi:hypothetical protein